MAWFKCEQCGVEFKRDKSGDRPIRFCNQACYHAWSKANKAYKGVFEAGHVPWSKGVKGLRLSPATEFKRGQKGRNWLPVGHISIRKDKNGTDRRFIKIAEPNKWLELAVKLWTDAYGPIPKGLVVHHIDHDALNDTISNYSLLTKAAHINEHREDLQRGKLSTAPSSN